MTDAAHRLYLSLARRLLTRARPPVWLNFIRYRVAIRKVRRDGPDLLPFSPPSVVVWATARCNRACPFCHYHGELNPPDAAGLELSAAQFQRLLGHPLVRRALRIALYGGEPLLNRDLFGMIRAGKRDGHLVTVNTNGLLLRDRAGEVLADPPDLLSVSVYADPREELERAIPLVAATMPVRLIVLLSAATLAEAGRAAELALRTGARSVCFERICPNAASDLPPLDAGDPAFRAVKAGLDAKYGRRVAIRWPASRPDANCRFFWNTAFIDARGRLSPCCIWPLSTYGDDIFANEKAWNAGRMQALRRDMRAGNFDPRCRTCAYLRDDPLGI